MKLPKFVESRARGDLIECYKILHGHYSCDLSRMFTYNTNFHLRGRPYKLDTERCDRLVRKHFLSNRVVDMCNRLPASVVGGSGTECFQQRFRSDMGQSVIWCAMIYDISDK